MKISVLGTGSKGNCIILTNTDGKFIVLDCGLKYERITTNDDFTGFENLSFVFVSHMHSDHSMAMKQFILAGSKVYYWDSEPRKVNRVDNFEFAFFRVKHNVANRGIIIKDLLTNEIYVYVVDFCEMPKINGVDHWIYEVNWDEETINKKIMEEGADFRHIHSGLCNHNSLENALEYFSGLDKKPKNIFIAHRSKDHGNEKRIQTQMKKFADNVEVLKRGMVIEI